MAEKHEFESIDEIFRKTFQDLPETPAASGWDTPSDHVWRQVQKGIETRHTGWSASAKLLALISISVVTAVGIYLGVQQDSPVSDAPVPVEVAAPAPALMESTRPVETAPAPVAAPVPATPSRSKPTSTATAPVIAPASPEPASEYYNQTQKAASHPEQQSTKPKPPNSVERERQKNYWKTPLNVLPPSRSGSPTGVPRLPDTVKQD